MKTDIEIAQSVELKPIVDVVEKLGISYDDLELYGKYKAKLSFDKIREVESNPVGKLILVTAINPTPAGVTIPLSDLYSTAKTRGTEHTVQVDFTTPLGKGQTLSTGTLHSST